MALSDIYQVRGRQKYGTGGKEMETVWFYERTAGAGGSADLAVLWGEEIGALINALQTTNIKNYSVDVINLGDLEDFIALPWVGTGVVEDDTMPPYVAYGYTTKLNTRAVRHGGKRVSGVPETGATNGVVTAAPVLANMETLRLAMFAELAGGDDTFLPIVVKRVREEVADTEPQQYTYRLPETDGELVFGEIVVALTSPNLTSQVSRKL